MFEALQITQEFEQGCFTCLRLVTVVLHDPKRYQSVVRGCVQHHSSSEGFQEWIPGFQLPLPLPLPSPFHVPLPHPPQLLTPPHSVVATLAHVLADEIPTHLVETRTAFSQARGRKRFLPVLFPTSNSCPCSQNMIP